MPELFVDLFRAGVFALTCAIVSLGLLFGGRASLQWFGAAFCCLAAVALAIPGLSAAWGFAYFLLGCSCWLIFGVGRRQWSLVTQHSVLAVLGVVGLWNYWLGPLLLGRS